MLPNNHDYNELTIQQEKISWEQYWKVGLQYEPFNFYLTTFSEKKKAAVNSWGKFVFNCKTSHSIVVWQLFSDWRNAKPNSWGQLQMAPGSADGWLLLQTTWSCSLKMGWSFNCWSGVGWPEIMYKRSFLGGRAI